MDRLQEEHGKMKEDSTVSQEATISEIESLRDKLSAVKEQLSESLLENKTLKQELQHLKTVASEFSGKTNKIAKVNRIENDESAASSESDNAVESNTNGSDIFIKADEDLTNISGVGPKLETHLKANGISNLEKFSELSVDNLKDILAKEEHVFVSTTL
ncbi:MAG: helix-hairpin-helix domain-containing protein [Saprospiraceae bacterium]|nr:helix-hairpin-helix domain-containing protein [Saprospiraceae bacterium]